MGIPPQTGPRGRTDSFQEVLLRGMLGSAMYIEASAGLLDRSTRERGPDRTPGPAC